MPKIVDRDGYRKELLDKCLGIFCRKGYSNVTMRGIAGEIGVSTGTIYHYFPSKDKILDELFTHVGEANVSEYLHRVRGVERATERLSIIADFWKEHHRFYQNMLLISLDVFRNDTAGHSEEVFGKLSEYYIDAIALNLEISRESGKAVFIYMIGTVLHSLFTPNRFDHTGSIGFIREMLDVVLEAHSLDSQDKRDRAMDRMLGLITRHVGQNAEVSDPPD